MKNPYLGSVDSDDFFIYFLLLKYFSSKISLKGKISAEFCIKTSAEAPKDFKHSLRIYCIIYDSKLLTGKT